MNHKISQQIANHQSDIKNQLLLFEWLFTLACQSVFYAIIVEIK